MNADEIYILQHAISEYELKEALKLPRTEGFEYLRKKTVDSQCSGYYKPGPFYKVGEGQVTLYDAWEVNVRHYTLKRIINLALSNPHVVFGPEKPFVRQDKLL